MRLLVAIPVYEQFEIGRISLMCFDQITSQSTDFLLIDNGSRESDYKGWLKKHNFGPKRWTVHTNPQNLGLIKSAQQAYEYALSFGYNLLCLTHNDVWLYQQNWDLNLKTCFQEIDKLGGVGLFGSKGCGKEGHRIDTFGSLIEIAGHGRKMDKYRIEGSDCEACQGTGQTQTGYSCSVCQSSGKYQDYPPVDRGHPSYTNPLWEPAVVFDGFFMCFSMKMLKEAGGFDQRYEMHHIYDYDASLTSIKLGYKNIVLNIPCHHLSGLTANNAAFSTSGQDVHQRNYEKWLEKWSPHLGVGVDEQFNYRWNL